MMTTTLKIKQGDYWYDLDLYEDVPISAVISSEDIVDIGTSNYRYTKTFTIPGTKKNNQVFNDFYSVIGLDFDPLLKLQCVVERGGSIIFEGFLRLNAVLFLEDKIEYEVYILTELSDLSTRLQAISLRDLDYQDLNHQNVYSAITKSWEYSGTTGGLFDGQIVYPLIDYGYTPDENGNVPFEFCLTGGVGSSCFTDIGNPIPEEYFKPAIQVKSVIERIFSATTYTLQSTFFNSDYFKSIYMTTANNGRVGINIQSSGDTQDPSTDNQNVFKVYTPTNINYSYDANDLRKPIPFGSFQPDGYDPLGSYTLDNDFPGPTNDDYKNYFNVPVQGDYYFNLKFDYKNITGLGVPCYFRIKAYKSNTPSFIDQTGTLFYQTPGAGLGATGGFNSANVFFSGNLQADEYVSVYVEIINTAGSPNEGVSLFGYNRTNTPMFELYESPTLLGTNDVFMSYQMPNIPTLTFLNTFISMFNLVVIKDEEEKTITIEPYVYYYRDSNRTRKDWTPKLDTSQVYRVEPLDFNLNKNIKWTYLSGKEEQLNTFWENTYNEIFGEFEYGSYSNILTGSKELSYPFSPSPCQTIPGGDDFIIPGFYDVDDNNIHIPEGSNPHLLFWQGNRWIYRDVDKTIPDTIFIASGTGTPVEWSTYPSFSHLSRYTTGNTFSDLNFKPSWDYWYSVNTGYTPYSPYTIYTSFWKDWIENIYSPDARRLIGRFLIDPLEIKDIKLNDLVYVKDTFWRVERIVDADLVNKKLVEVYLIKELSGFIWSDPPAPIYDIYPNEAHPTP